jgi:hypothetical protein
LQKLPKEGNFVAKEVKVKEVRMDFCIYEVSWYICDENGMITSMGGYTIQVPCPWTGISGLSARRQWHYSL